MMALGSSILFKVIEEARESNISSNEETFMFSAGIFGLALFFIGFYSSTRNNEMTHLKLMKLKDNDEQQRPPHPPAIKRRQITRG